VPAGPAALASPVVAHPDEAVSKCTRATGVLVVVDFRYWGDPVERGCAPTPTTGTRTTGYVALHDAGFTTAGDAHDGDAFICRIDDRPTPSQDACQSTPLPPEYWGYWHAKAGQNTWTFSNLGAQSYKPPPGSVDAWTYGSTAAPTFTPAQARAGTVPAATTTTTSTTTTTTPTATTPTTTTPTTTTPTTPVPRTTTPKATTTTTVAPAKKAHAGSRSTTTTTRRDHHSKAKAKRPVTHKKAARSPKTTPTPTTSPPTTALRIVNVASGADKSTPSSGSSPVGLIIGLALVAVVGGVALVTARRRRRTAG
jgi:hypothetical protein